MAIKKKKYLVLIPLIGIVGFLFYKNTYIEFEPTIFDGNSYKKIEVNSMFYKNLEIVLDYNNIKYKIDKQGKVLVKRNLSVDKESLFNYTEKAFDTVWLNAHKELN
jgi:hypothetical protein